MVLIVYLLKNGFQAYIPNFELRTHGKMCYNMDGINSFIRQCQYEYSATSFVVHIICT